MLLQAAVNGSRMATAASPVPASAGAIVDDAARALAAGAGAIHAHVRDASGRETLDPDATAALVTRFRAACPGASLGVTTGAWIAEDAAARARAIAAWHVLPDVVSINMDEEGAVPLARHLLARGVELEAGLANPRAAAIFVDSQLPALRILFEPEPQIVAAALAQVAEMERLVARHPAPRLLHGYDATTWPLLAAAAHRGYDTRIGFEDTLTLPDGQAAPDNAALVRAALAMLGGV